MPIELMRTALRPLYRGSRSIHPGLMIQRGLEYFEGDADRQNCEDNQGNRKKTLKQQHIEGICALPVNDIYRNAYQRWLAATADEMRFRSLIVAIDGRLLIGLNGGGALETGCAISHSYGVPFLPGSSIKGIVQHHVRGTVFGKEHRDVCDDLFGAGPSEADADQATDQGLAGLVSFHDAWWVPGSAPKPQVDRPFAQEVVTTHHPGYYQHEGRFAASDFDSPIPNAQVGVHGSFLITLEGDPAWTELTEQMLIATLAERGIGAKTRAGYGYANVDQNAFKRMEKTRAPLAQARRTRIEAQRKEREEAIDTLLERNLPPQQQVLKAASKAISILENGPDMGGKREAILSEINTLLQTAAAWPDAADRNAAADLVTETFDRIGWMDKAGKQKQKERREKKIAQLRNGEAQP